MIIFLLSCLVLGPPALAPGRAQQSGLPVTTFSSETSPTRKGAYCGKRCSGPWRVHPRNCGGTAGPGGETLRGLLLNAYAFGTMGMIAGIAAIAAFIAAAVMLVLGGLGLIHARRTSPTTDILDGHPARTPDPSTAPLQTTPASDQEHSGNGLAGTARSVGPSA